MNLIRLISLSLCFISIHFDLSVALQCQDWLTPTDETSVNVDNNETNPVQISGSDDQFVAILIDPNLFLSMNNQSSLVINDGPVSNISLATVTRDDLNGSSLYILSLTPQVSLYLNYQLFGDEVDDVNVTIPYAFLNQSSTVVNPKYDGQHWIVTNGTDDCQIVNFRRTWLVTPGEDNVVHYYLTDVTLDDNMGDYLAIGTGNEPFTRSPSMMISGNNHKGKDVDVYGNITYVHVFSKLFSSGLGFALFYNTSLYIPPTDEPPTTVQPTATLNATVKVENSTNISPQMQRFEDVIDTYATLTCQGIQKNYQVNLSVEVTKVVQINSCLVIVYFVNVYNGSCQGNKTFTLDSYNQMMTNFSSNITDDFGYMGTSCPVDNTLWIIAVVIVAGAAVITLLFAVLSRKGYLYKKLRKSDSDVYETKVTQNMEFDPVNEIQRVDQEENFNPNNYLWRHDVIDPANNNLIAGDGGHDNPSFHTEEDDTLTIEEEDSHPTTEPYTENQYEPLRIASRDGGCVTLIY